MNDLSRGILLGIFLSFGVSGVLTLAFGVWLKLMEIRDAHEVEQELTERAENGTKN